MNPILYQEAKQEFHRRKNLPDNHVDKINNMRDWLIHYNLLDVKPLVEAIEKSFSTSVYHRHLDLSGRVDSPHAARHTPDGSTLTHAVFLDFNSMYLWTESEAMPLYFGLRKGRPSSG